MIGRSTSMGARNLVHSSVLSGDSSNGQYLIDCKPAPFAGYGDSGAGRITQGWVWDLTSSELRPVMNVEQVLSEI